ncbi:MAG: hypothetical protein EBR82_22505 [Caulobacteraceae bacterium]|nr:hypothetical protein [Caulobacteraceae bacterium]
MNVEMTVRCIVSHAVIDSNICPRDVFVAAINRMDKQAGIGLKSIATRVREIGSETLIVRYYGMAGGVE